MCVHRVGWQLLHEDRVANRVVEDQVRVRLAHKGDARRHVDELGAVSPLATQIVVPDERGGGSGATTAERLLVTVRPVARVLFEKDHTSSVMEADAGGRRRRHAGEFLAAAAKGETITPRVNDGAELVADCERHGRQTAVAVHHDQLLLGGEQVGDRHVATARVEVGQLDSLHALQVEERVHVDRVP